MKKTPDRPAHSLGYLTGSISQVLSDRLRRNFAQEGLDMPHAQYVLLADLFAQDGQTQQQLAAKVFKDKAAVKRTVDLLVEKGLVQRASASSVRNNPVSLTRRARALEPLLRRVAARTLTQATRNLLPGELETCLGVLRKLHSHLEMENETGKSA